MIGIVDYGVGNVLAFAHMYKRMNVAFKVVKSAQDCSDVSGVILPGVGSFDFAMSRLNSSGLRDVLDRVVLQDTKPVLGICVGMQMLADRSDEGELPGLGWIPGEVKKFRATEVGSDIHLPHMGWDNLTVIKDNQLLNSLNSEAWFYYLHSYYFECAESSDELASCDYGQRFACVVKRDNVYGVQFHPEKSHDYGARLLKNFSEFL